MRWDEPPDYPVCEACGDDLAVDGYRLCLECLEALEPDSDWLAVISADKGATMRAD